MINRKLVIIGGGPAGLAAAVAAYDKGERDILILERESVLGGILNISFNQPKQGKIHKDNATTSLSIKSGDFYAGETIKYGDFVHKVDDKQGVFFAVHYIDPSYNNWKMKDLEFPELSYSAVDYEQNIADTVDTVVEFGYADQSFYVYGEGIKGHFREYEPGFFIFPDTNYAPSINIKKSSNGFTYLGYTLHGFENYPSGCVPTRSVITDLTKNYIHEWNLLTGKQKTNTLDGSTTATVTKNRSILVNIYFYKSSDITVEANSTLGSITTDLNITDYQNGQSSITIENCPIGTKLSQNKVLGNPNINYMYKLSYNYPTYKDNVEYKNEYSKEFYALERDQVYVEEESVYTFNNLNEYYDIPFKLETKSLSFNIELDVAFSDSLYFYATYGKYKSDEFKALPGGKQTLTITIDNIPAYYQDDLIIYYIYKDVTNSYYNPYKYCLSPNELNLFNYTTNPGTYVTLLSDYYLENNTTINEPVGYMYQLYSVSYTSDIENISELPESKLVLHNSLYEVEKTEPSINDTEHQFVGYRHIGSSEITDSIIIKTDLVFYPLYCKKQNAYLINMDSTTTEITGTKYTSNLKTYFNNSWDISSLPIDSTITNGYSFIYWIEDKVNNPYEMKKITTINELQDGHTYYSLAFKAYIAKYIINTNNSIYGYSHHTSENGYAKYLISNGTKTPTYFSEVTVSPYSTPTATNGTFLGFTLDLSSNVLYQPGDVISVSNSTDELVFYAKWTELRYNLTIIYFEQDGNMEAEVISGSYNETITIKTPEIEGYTFKNYKLINENYTGRLTTKGSTYQYTFGTTNDTIKANWNVKTNQVNIKLNTALTKNIKFTINVYVNDTLTETFNVDTSSNSLYSIMCEYQTNVSYRIINSNSGYNISFDEPSTDYTEYFNYNHIVTSDGINLLILNVTQIYTISFDGNNNTCNNNVATIRKLHNEEVQLPQNPFERTDYVNNGWGSYSSSSIPITTYKKNENIKLYSIWLSKITFHTGDEEFYILVDNNSKYDLPQAPTKEGYTFLGWSFTQYTSIDWTSGSQGTNRKHWYAVWEGYDLAEKREIAHTLNIYAEPYISASKYYSYKVDLYENVSLKYNYTLDRKEVINYNNATIIPNSTYYTTIDYPTNSTSLPIAGYSQDINTLTPTWTEGEREITSDETWYAICYYVSDIQYDVKTLTHTFYIGENNYFTKETTVTTPIFATVIKKNYGQTLAIQTDEYTNFGNVRYSELTWQTVTLSQWGQVDKDFIFLGWADSSNTLEVVWDNQRSIVPQEDKTYYAIYRESKTRYIDVTEFDITLKVSNDETNIIKASRTTTYLANNICNFDNSFRELLNTISVEKQVGTIFEFPSIQPEYAECEFIGWSSGENYFDQINKPGKTVEIRSNTTYYAVYKMLKDECLSIENQTYYFILSPNRFEKVIGQVEYIYKNVARYYSYDLNNHTIHYLSHEGLLSTNELPLVIPNYDDKILGWNVHSSSTEVKYNNIIENPDNTYYYAIWNSEKTINLTYYFFEGFDNFTETVTFESIRNFDGTNVIDKQVEIPLSETMYSREYDLNYWYILDSYNEIKYDFSSSITTTYKLANDIVIYGNVSKKACYTISYLDDTPSFTMYKGEKLTLKTCTLTKDNYIFSHWDINGIVYKPGDIVIIESDTYIIPQYIPIPVYYVTYTHTNETIELSQDTVITLPSGPENETLTFQHWLVNDQIYYPDEELIIIENIIITPVYNQTITYAVTYSNSLDTMLVEENDTITLTEPSNIEGYEFDYYSVNGQTYNVNDVVTITSDTHITLVYKNLSSQFIIQKQQPNFTIIFIIISSLIVVGTTSFVIIWKRKKS